MLSSVADCQHLQNPYSHTSQLASVPRYGEDKVYIVGQMAYGGEVSAAPEWNAPVKRMRLRPATEGAEAEIIRLHLSREPCWCTAWSTAWCSAASISQHPHWWYDKAVVHIVQACKMLLLCRVGRLMCGLDMHDTRAWDTSLHSVLLGLDTAPDLRCRLCTELTSLLQAATRRCCTRWACPRMRWTCGTRPSRWCPRWSTRGCSARSASSTATPPPTRRVRQLAQPLEAHVAKHSQLQRSNGTVYCNTNAAHRLQQRRPPVCPHSKSVLGGLRSLGSFSLLTRAL